MTRDELRAALAERNVIAFLAVIRAGEGTSDPDGYRRHFGGDLFDSFADHPRRAVTAGGYTSTAAGCYQFLARTWDSLVAQYGFPDFSPACQDEGAVALIAGRGALPAVRAGRLAEAIRLCNREWASLPGSPYGQPTRTMVQAVKTYTAAGGVLDAPGGVTTPPTQEAPMLPFVAAALPALIQAAPALIRAFGDSPQAEKNARAAETVAEIAKQATGQPTIEGAVQAIQTDPAHAAAYREAVHASLPDIEGLLLRAHQADEASRDKATDRNIVLASATGGRWLWLVGAVALLVVLASYGIVTLVLLRDGFSDETRALLLGQVVILGFGTVITFLFGSSLSSKVAQAKQQ